MTLIQMAIFLVIISIMMVPFFQWQTLMQKKDLREQQFGDVNTVATALKNYVARNGAYPLPAPLNANIYNSPSAGLPIDRTLLYAPGLTDPDIESLPLGATPPNDYGNNGALFRARFCRGARIPNTPALLPSVLVTANQGSPWAMGCDSNFPSFDCTILFSGPNFPGWGDTPSGCFNPVPGMPVPITTAHLPTPMVYNNLVIHGAVPYTVLGLNPSQSLDRFGNKLIYAVTYGQTMPSTFNDRHGNISIISDRTISFFRSAPGITRSNHWCAGVRPPSERPPFAAADFPPDELIVGLAGGFQWITAQAHFVVVSNGADRVGAWTAIGQKNITMNPASGNAERPPVEGGVSCPSECYALQGMNCNDFRRLTNGNWNISRFAARFRVLAENHAQFNTPSFRLRTSYNLSDRRHERYFDDSLAWATTAFDSPWTQRDGTGGGTGFETYLTSGTKPDRYGAGASLAAKAVTGNAIMSIGDTPSVQGQVQVNGPSNNVRADQVNTARFCAGSGRIDNPANCYDPFSILSKPGPTSPFPLISVGSDPGTNPQVLPKEMRVADPSGVRLSPGTNIPTPACVKGVLQWRTDGTFVCNP
jgi:hypothetical protein